MARSKIVLQFMAVAGSLLLLLASCSPEKKIASKYVKEHKGTGILILPLYKLQKDNLTISYDTNVKYTPDQFDSIAWYQSYYVQHVSDSVFLTTFTNTFINGLASAGYDVYVEDDSDVFLSLPDPKWVVQIGQISLNEEHKIEYRDMYSVESGETYQQDYRTNQINLESWLDVSKANSPDKEVLYLEGYIKDKVKVKIGLNFESGGLGIVDLRDSLTLNDIYRMAEASGKKHAELLFDHFMNKYIAENLPSGLGPVEYYHYNRERNSFKRGSREKFEVVN